MPSTCRPLPRAFFNLSPLQVAPALLGKLLVRRRGREERRVRLVETEAYLGSGDRAAHSAAGRTARNAVLFGPPGHAYVYFIYGMYYCLNVSTLPDGEAGGVLFRAAEEEEAVAPRTLSGPGRLARALGVDLRLNGCDLTRSGPLFLADDGFLPARIARGPRVGIRKDAHLPLRFFLPGHPALSR
ncbi:MAG TPA: DNA-3-methyladenine glycosylase [Terriglobales bacterium]|nr:DNA-3-methyladenine glycosylase [Terriglobales bacterium]